MAGETPGFGDILGEVFTSDNTIGQIAAVAQLVSPKYGYLAKTGAEAWSMYNDGVQEEGESAEITSKLASAAAAYFGPMLFGDSWGGQMASVAVGYLIQNVLPGLLGDMDVFGDRAANDARVTEKLNARGEEATDTLLASHEKVSNQLSDSIAHGAPVAGALLTTASQNKLTVEMSEAEYVQHYGDIEFQKLTNDGQIVERASIDARMQQDFERREDAGTLPERILTREEYQDDRGVTNGAQRFLADKGGFGLAGLTSLLTGSGDKVEADRSARGAEYDVLMENLTVQAAIKDNAINNQLNAPEQSPQLADGQTAQLTGNALPAAGVATGAAVLTGSQMQETLLTQNLGETDPARISQHNSHLSAQHERHMGKYEQQIDGLQSDVISKQAEHYAVAKLFENNQELDDIGNTKFLPTNTNIERFRPELNEYMQEFKAMGGADQKLATAGANEFYEANKENNTLRGKDLYRNATKGYEDLTTELQQVQQRAYVDNEIFYEGKMQGGWENGSIVTRNNREANSDISQSAIADFEAGRVNQPASGAPKPAGELFDEKALLASLSAGGAGVAQANSMAQQVSTDGREETTHVMDKFNQILDKDMSKDDLKLYFQNLEENKGQAFENGNLVKDKLQFSANAEFSQEEQNLLEKHMKNLTNPNSTTQNVSQEKDSFASIIGDEFRKALNGIKGNIEAQLVEGSDIQRDASGGGKIKSANAGIDV